jgi:hypothetical protein
MNITNFLLSIFGFSIWEEYIIVFLTLYIIKSLKLQNHNYFELGYNHIFCKNLLKIFIFSVFPIAIMTNLFTALHINENIITLLSIVLLYVSINILLGKNISLETRIKFIPCIFISLLLVCFIDLSFYKLLFNITNTNLGYIQSHVYNKIIFGIFPRLIEFSGLSILLYKINVGIKTNVLDTIIKNKYLLLLSSSMIIFDAIISIFFCQNIILGNILKHSSDLYKELAILSVFIVSTLNIIVGYFIATFIQYNERKKYKYGN